MNEDEKKLLIAEIKKSIGETFKEHGIEGREGFQKLMGRLAALEQAVADPTGARGAMLPNGALRNPFEADAFKQRVKQVVDGQPSSGNILLPGVGIKSLKALTNFAGGTTSGFPTQPQRGPTVPPVTPPISLIDVLPSTPVTADNFEFVQLTRTSAAEVVSEGGQKPETEFEANLETAKIATIAHWTQASKQVLADNASLGEMLGRILSVDVVAKYENLLLNGDGTTDKIHGLIPQATVFSHSAAPKPDRISECLAAMWNIGYVGSVVVMNPFDWHTFETERAESGDGQYVAGGGWANPAAPTVWRTPVARAAGLAVGSALVLDTRFITMLDRQQVQTLVSAEDRDNFIKNLITLLAEMRGGLAVYDTAAVQLVDLAST